MRQHRASRVLVAVTLVTAALPFLDAGAVTTFTDQGTGAAGRGASGATYDLYAGMDGLLEFPVRAQLIPAVLLLQVGPWQFNIMGLYVILLLVSPLVLAALARVISSPYVVGLVTILIVSLLNYAVLKRMVFVRPGVAASS